ncbi:hypothetical protein SUGI_0501320 [Cryptomeria japonica]|nr:hypothetical protein SUGI_0501320 [Cryptomeria japonica]
MEKHTGKRERIEKSDESGMFCEEPEAIPPKRICKDFHMCAACEIMSKYDELDLGPEEIEEEMVWDMMKMLEEQIAPTPSFSDDTGITSNGSDKLEFYGDEGCSFNAELDYLFGASDDELGVLLWTL